MALVYPWLLTTRVSKRVDPGNKNTGNNSVMMGTCHFKSGRAEIITKDPIRIASF